MAPLPTRMQRRPDEIPGGGGVRLKKIEKLTGFRWPARCLHCDLVTEDPDAYFLPDDVDDELISDDQRCWDSPTGLHEPEPVAA